MIQLNPTLCPLETASYRPSIRLTSPHPNGEPNKTLWPNSQPPYGTVQRSPTSGPLPFIATRRHPSTPEDAQKPTPTNFCCSSRGVEKPVQTRGSQRENDKAGAGCLAETEHFGIIPLVRGATSGVGFCLATKKELAHRGSDALHSRALCGQKATEPARPY